MIVAIHNKNGQGLLRFATDSVTNSFTTVAIHNKNGQGLLRKYDIFQNGKNIVAIHNKNGQGLLLNSRKSAAIRGDRRNPQ